MEVTGPAIALLELESIARGYVAADLVLKRAAVEIVLAEPTTPGKYLLLFQGGVAEVEESLRAAEESVGTLVLDRLYLPGPAPALLRALRNDFSSRRDDESLGIVETHSVAAALLAADTALKRADVRLVHLHLARGIGGRGYFTLAGSLNMVEAALEASAACLPANLLLTTEIVRRPHPELRVRGS